MTKRILLGVVATALIIAAAYANFYIAPTERTMGVIQRIFYFHAATAWAGEMVFFVCFVANLLYVWKREQKYDWLGVSGAEVGLAFTTVVLITGPILFPVAVGLGINPIHLGILMTVNMEVGLCHPPVGLNLYVASGIAKMGITELTIAVWPWLLTMLAFLGIVTYVPELSLWLPRMLGMM